MDVMTQIVKRMESIQKQCTDCLVTLLTCPKSRGAGLQLAQALRDMGEVFHNLQTLEQALRAVQEERERQADETDAD